MVAKKRPAAASVAPSPKRGRKSVAAASSPKRGQKSVTKREYDQIAEAIQDAEQLPDSVRTMLIESIPQTLGVFKDNRQQFQNEFVGMIKATLDGVEAGLQNSVAEAEAKVSEQSGEKTTLDAQQSGADAVLSSKRDAEAEMKKALTEASEARNIQKKALDEAQAAQKHGDADLEAAAGKKEKLENAQKETYVPLKEGSIEGKGDINKAVKTLMSTCKEFGFDTSLISTVSGVLPRPPAERGDFGNMTLVQLEGEFSKSIAAFSETIANGESGKAERAVAVESAQKVFETVDDQFKTCHVNLVEAQAAVKEAQKELASAVAAVKAFAPTILKLESARDKEKANLMAFTEGPLATFRELEARTTPTPPPTEESGDAVAPEAPAEDAVAPEASAAE